MLKKIAVFLLAYSFVFIALTAAGCNKPRNYEVVKNTDNNSAEKQAPGKVGTESQADTSQAGSEAKSEQQGTGEKDPSPADIVVEIRDDGFHPSELEIKAGTKIIWQNNSSGYPRIHENSNAFISDKIPPGQKLEGTFRTSGTFSYHNHAHDTGVSMQGTIVIK